GCGSESGRNHVGKSADTAGRTPEAQATRPLGGEFSSYKSAPAVQGVTHSKVSPQGVAGVSRPRVTMNAPKGVMGGMGMGGMMMKSAQTPAGSIAVRGGMGQELRAKSESEVYSSSDVPPPGTEAYNKIVENPFHRAASEPLSTFSIDVDTASYA